MTVQVKIHATDAGFASKSIVKKVKGLKAKHMRDVLNDAVAAKMLLNTFEGEQPVTMTNMYCEGEAGDAWQQTPAALVKKYNLTGITADGWLEFTPKPENEAEGFMWTGPAGYIRGQWGKTIGGETNLQAVKPGDWILRQPHDHTDVWVVNDRLFANTYAVQ